MLFEPRSQDGLPRIHNQIAPTLNTAQGGQRQPCVVFNTLQDPVPNENVAPCLSTGNPKTGQASLAVVYSKGTRPHNKDEAQIWEQKDVANTLNTNDVGESRANELIVMATQQGGAEIGYNLCPTITAAAGMSGNNQPVLAYSLDRATFNQGKNALFNIGIDDSGIAHTIVAKGPGAVAYGIDCRNATENEEICPTLQAKGKGGGFSLNCSHPIRVGMLIRRVTPTECARLQGMPDWWCDDVPHYDSAEYKMWGNGMALPCVMYVFEGVAKVVRSRWLDSLLEVVD